MASSPVAHAASQDQNWSQKETADLVVLWDESKVLSQFVQSEHSNVHIYESL